MTEPNRLLPSWRPGRTRDAVVAFLERSDELAPIDRVAVFDNDGTLWCEKPLYPQLGFFLHELARAIADEPSLAEREEYAALIANDQRRVAELGLPRVGMALNELFVGMSPDEFTERSVAFLFGTPHPSGHSRYADAIYLPMLELLDALRAHGFATFIATGGGTEFVRAVSHDLYAIPPEAVVGTLVGYEYRTVDGVPALVRTGSIVGEANEGAAKVVNIQQAVGRRPIFAAGNSAGDREMIEWALSGEGPSLGLLIDHDDADREAAYDSVAASFESSERIVDVARRQGWTVVSMRDDWSTIYR
jgi:phosphoserine phosphatase